MLENKDVAHDEHEDEEAVRVVESAASFADAETREILKLLGDSGADSGCCGGTCCSA